VVRTDCELGMQLLPAAGVLFSRENIALDARVLLVDDNQDFLNRTADLLGDHFQIVGFAKNGLEAVEKYRRLCPDLVILDVSMPVMDGFTAARELAKFDADVKIIFLSIEDSAALHEVARTAGVLACVSKIRIYKDLLPAVRSALQGHFFLSALVD